MPAKRPRNGHDTAERIDRIERQLANDRLDRIERAIERAVAANDDFRAVVRSAFTVQQEQISELRKTVEQVAREWQAYLRTIHPPQ